MNTHPLLIVSLASVLVTTAAVAHAQHPAMPPGMTHEEHLAQMQKDADLKKRGAEAMGFDQEKTTHHFRLSPAGGAIEVTVTDAADAVSRDQVRAHLQSIASAFGQGDFAKPMATHAELPPGVQVMQQHIDALTFRYEELPAGGRVSIATTEVTTLEAVHAFLRYQIREHGTGDAMTVSK
jgi:hypothetical protein